MNETFKESMALNRTNYNQLKPFARAYSMKRECSVQEAVYHIIPELWLQKAFPALVFSDTNIPKNYSGFF